jgi:TPR repeat protein
MGFARFRVKEANMHNAMAKGSSVCAVVFIGLLVFTGCETREQRFAREWQEGCSAGDPDKCANLGESYAKGIGVPLDPARAATIYRDACNRDGVRACLLLGEAYAKGDGVTKDTGQASAFLGRACEAGEEEACVRACDVLNDSVRCLRVGVLSGKGAKDLTRAASYFRKACDNGHPLGCREAGTMYRDGFGVPKDANRATQLLRRADELLRTACSAASRPDYCDM